MIGDINLSFNRANVIFYLRQFHIASSWRGEGERNLFLETTNPPVESFTNFGELPFCQPSGASISYM